MNKNIESTLKILPKKPGVYIFKDSKGRIIYVGKAKSLINRVKSYFVPNESIGHVNHPISFFRSRISSIDFIQTDNEIEALILESNLIKQNRPKYNVSLKDDKSYPYIAITEEKFPRVFMTRNRNFKGIKYFGPYTNVKAIRDMLDTLQKVFQIRDCKKAKPGKVRNTECLNFHIGLCSAPCTGRILEPEYKKNIEYIRLFLKGRDNSIISGLKNEMFLLSEKKEFEEAAKVKMRIDAVNSIFSDQKVFLKGERSWDILSVFKDEKAQMASVSVYSYKDSELAAISNFIIVNVQILSEQEIISGFIKNYYSEIDNMASTVYIPTEIEDLEAIALWLSGLKGKKINIRIPRKGEKKEITGMATRNAMLYLEKKKFEKSLGYSRVFNDLLNLKDMLVLKNIPKRIECFDISNIGSSFAVGSMAVFVDGAPLNSNYRQFKIRTVSGQDDISMLVEVLRRRSRYLERNTVDIENSFYIKPDLIVIDGGKAQFNAVEKLLKETGMVGNIDLISIAKKEEKIYSERFPYGFRLDISENHAKIILRIRDEAHRFAVTYHRKLRSKGMTGSVLDGIRGIGPKKREYILEKFPTPEDLKACRLEDLLNIKGISYKDAKNIFNNLNRY